MSQGDHQCWSSSWFLQYDVALRGVFLLPPGQDAKFASTHLYSWVERGTVQVKCVAQEYNTMSPARAQTLTARSGDKSTNHKATKPPIHALQSFHNSIKSCPFHQTITQCTYNCTCLFVNIHNRMFGIYLIVLVVHLACYLFSAAFSH